MTQNTLLNEATSYEPKLTKTKNIADLGIVNLSSQIVDDEVTDKKTGAKKMQKVVLVDDVKYRIPSPVLEQIQNIIKVASAYGKVVEKVKITRTGTTQTDTRYKVEPVI